MSGKRGSAFLMRGFIWFTYDWGDSYNSFSLCWEPDLPLKQWQIWFSAQRKRMEKLYNYMKVNVLDVRNQNHTRGTLRPVGRRELKRSLSDIEYCLATLGRHTYSRPCWPSAVGSRHHGKFFTHFCYPPSVWAVWCWSHGCAAHPCHESKDCAEGRQWLEHQVFLLIKQQKFCHSRLCLD